MGRNKKIDEIRYLGGWRENEKCCYMVYDKLSNKEINKILGYEGIRLCESK